MAGVNRRGQYSRDRQSRYGVVTSLSAALRLICIFCVFLILPSVASAQVCGNGLVESGEACDDKNYRDGDGCSALCQLEARSCTNRYVAASGQPYSTVLAAYNAAQNGDNIVILPGAYNVDALRDNSTVISKNVHFVGAGALPSDVVLNANIGGNSLRVDFNAMTAPVREVGFRNLTYQRNIVAGACDISVAGNASDPTLAGLLLENTIFPTSSSQIYGGCLVSGKATFTATYSDYSGSRASIFRASGAGAVLSVYAKRIYGISSIESEAAGGIVNWTLADITDTRAANGTYSYSLPSNLFPCVSTPNCGDGFVQRGEDCDDGNLDNTDSCTNACRSPSCGDGFQQLGEQCDDGNAVDTDSCTSLCKLAVCGDGHIQVGEVCDDGNTSNNDSCTNQCQTATCGDGYLQSGEECDDGDLNDTNACTNACTVSPNICSGPGGSDLVNYAAGLGTEGSPYVICNSSQLAKIGGDLSSYFRLGQNIDASSISSPIAGTFQGTFDGAGFTISLLAINKPSDLYVGLFARVGTAGEVRRVVLDAPSVTGMNYVGAIAGYHQGEIHDVVVTNGQVVGSSFAGLVSGYSSGVIRQVVTSGNVTVSDSFAGGVTGDQRDGSVTLSRSSAVVGAAYDAGGIAGRLGGSGVIQNCYASASVSVNNASAGGLVGSLSGGALSQSFFYGTAAATLESLKAGGGVGSQSAGTVSGVVWNEFLCATCQFRPEGTYGVSTAGMKQLVFYASLGFDFSTKWGLEPLSYPSFLWEHPEFAVTRSIALGTGTALDPYLVSSVQDLEAIGLNASYRASGIYFSLTQDIDFGGVEYPLVGGPSSPFGGTFDGNGHTFSNFTLPWGGSDDVGMFRVIAASGVVKNLYVSGASVSGKNRAAIVSGTNYGRIENVRLDQVTANGVDSVAIISGRSEGVIDTVTVTQGQVFTSDDNGGGIVGYSRGTVIRAVYSGAVTVGDRNAGSIVGYQATGSVSLSRSAGQVDARYNSGGISGWMENGASSLSDAYSSAVVTASNYAGGVVGFVNAGTVQRTFFTGSATASGAPEKDGAILGGMISSSVAASLWSPETCPTCFLHLSGTFTRTDARLKNTLTYANLGFDFLTTWGMAAGSYPTLLWEFPGNQVNVALSSGTGTALDPYLISTYGDLEKLALNQAYWGSGVYVRLESDLNLALVEPPMLGLLATPFNADFNGNNYSISNVSLDYGSVDNVGLFKVLGTNGRVEDLTLVSPIVLGNNYVGAIVGQGAGTIERVAVQSPNIHGRNYVGGVGGIVTGLVRQATVEAGSILADSTYAGGIAGQLDSASSNYTKLVFAGSVSALSDYAGGIAGLLNYGTISLSTTSGTVSTGSSYSGGIAGYINQASSLLENSFSSTAVNAGFRHSGGIVGYLRLGTVRYTYFIGSSAASDVTYDGGTAGSNPGGTLTSNIYNSTICINCSAAFAGVEALSTSAMQYRLTYRYRGFDFATVWGMPGATGYPSLLWQNPGHLIQFNLTQGSGTGLDPYQIGNYADFEIMAMSSNYLGVGLNFALTQNIDLVGKVAPLIGSSANPFRGTIDGADYTLSNYNLSLPGYNYVGLIGSLANTGVVRNLNMSGATVNGGSYTGLIAGLSAGLVEDIDVVGLTVTSTSGGTRKGGLVGRNDGTVRNVSLVNPSLTSGTLSQYTGGVVGESTGSVANVIVQNVAISSGSTDTGGVVGFNTGTIFRTYVTGNLTSNEISTGGIAGYSSNYIRESEFHGTVQGKDHVGGVVGYTAGTAAIENNLVFANTTSTGDNAGGVVGYGGVSVTVRYNYFVGAASDLSGGTADGGVIGGSTPSTIYANFYNTGSCPGCTFKPAGIEGRTTDLMQQIQTYLTPGWDFVAVWGWPNPSDYPTLLWLHSGDIYTVPSLSQGSGLLADPFLIQSNADLITLGLNPSYWGSGVYLKLDADLDLTGIEPPIIGRSGNAFAGDFDGAGHSISGYATSLAGVSNVGLFGAIGASGLVHDITLNNFTINGTNYLGALAGTNAGTIEDIVLNTISITAQTGGTRKGGLVGRNDGLVQRIAINGVTVVSSAASLYTGGVVGENTGTAQDLSVSGLLLQSSSAESGGIAGRNSGTVRRAVVAGNITCTGDSVGGIVGYLTSNVRETEFSGVVQGQNYVGGVVGNSSGSPFTENNFVFGDVQCSADYAGGILGYGTASGTVRYNYYVGVSNDATAGTNDGGIVGGNSLGTVVGNFWNRDICPNCSYQPAGTEARTTARMKQVQTYYQAGFDFATVWGFPNPANYPTHLWLVPGDSYVVPSLTQGTGSVGDPFVINTLSDLTTLGLNSNYWVGGTYILLAADLNLSSIEPPLIGRAGNPFSGVFEGSGHRLQGYSYSLSGTNYLGLFAEVGASGEVRNLVLKDLNINGSSYVGGVAGRNLGTIENLSLDTVTVTANTGGTRKGGVAGRNEGTIRNTSLVTVSITSGATGQYAGGVVGESTGAVQDVVASAVSINTQSNDAGGAIGTNSGTVTRLDVQGIVTSTVDFAGGLVGSSSGGISKSSFNGTIQGRTSIGGVAGVLTATPLVENNYIWGNVTASGDNAGGVIGLGVAGATVRYNYFAGVANDSSGGTNDGGVFGATTATLSYSNLWNGELCPSCTYKPAGSVVGTAHNMRHPSIYLSLGFDFSSVWGMDVGNNYPVHLWSIPGSQVVFPPTPAGSGTVGDPYQIASADDLYAVAARSSLWLAGTHFIMTNDINYNSWGDIPTPTLGSTATSFSGVFNGQGFNIVNARWDFDGANDIAFVKILGAAGELRRVTFYQPYIRGDSRVAAAVATNAGLVQEVSVVVPTVVGSDYVGAVVGTTSGTITKVRSFTGSVTTEVQYGGGIVGAVTSGTVSEAYATATVSGANSLGGIAGFISGGTIENSFARATVSGARYIGGIVGYSQGGNTVQYAYFAGTASATTAADDGGISGFSSAGARVSSFWDNQVCTTCSHTYAGETSATTSTMKTAATYGVWSGAIWDKGDGYYPLLLWNRGAGVIFDHPDSQTVLEGTTASFAVGATGDSITYSWRLGGALLNDGTRPGGMVVSGATTSSLTLANVRRAEAGAVDALVSNPVGVIVSNAAPLVVDYLPSFTLQPVGAVLSEGSSYSMSATSIGVPTPTIGWYRGGTLEHTGSPFGWGAVTPADAGAYQARATNSVGTVSSNTVQVSVIGLIGDASVIEGQTASYSVVVTGNEQYAYQWQHKLAAGAWLDVPGETLSTLTLDTSMADDASQVRVRVTSPSGSSLSNVAALSVAIAPVGDVSTQASPNPILLGNNVTLTAVVGRGTAPFHYSWQKHVGGTWVNIGGAPDAASYTFSPLKTDNGVSYRAIASNAEWTTPGTAVSLNVEFPAAILTQPISAIAPIGGSVSLAIQLEGNPLPTVSWTKAGLPVGSGATFVLDPILLTQVGLYKATVANVHGSVDSDPIPVSVIQKPEDVMVLERQSVNFSTVVTGPGEFAYQWERKRTSGEWEAIVLETEASLVFSSLLVDDGALYRVRVSTLGSEAVSGTALLTVSPSAPTGVTVDPQAISGVAGEVIALTAQTVLGSMPLHYSWELHNGSSWGPLSGAVDSSTHQLTLDRSLLGKQLRVTVSNVHGSLSSVGQVLTVTYPPVFDVQPAKLVLVEGGSGQLAVTVDANPGATLQWYHEDVPLGTDSTEDIANATSAQSGVYRVQAVNAVGPTWSADGRVSIVHPLADQVVAVGAMVNITANITGGGEYTYQWEQRPSGGDWATIIGATGRTFLFPARVSDHRSQYRVTVTEAGSHATSLPMTLGVGGPTGVTVSLNLSTPVVDSGGQSSFLATALNATAPLHYSWQELTGSGWVAIAGAPDASSALITMNADDHNRGFRVLLTCVEGEFASNSVTQLVRSAPSLSTQPPLMIVAEGASVARSLVVEGYPAPQVEWFKDGLKVQEGPLTFSSVAPSDVGLYYARATNDQGFVESDSFSVSVIRTVVDQVAVHTTQAQFGAQVDGGEVYTYQWQVSENQGQLWTNLLNETGDTLTVTADIAKPQNLYRVQVTSQGIVGNSNEAELEVLPAIPAEVELSPETQSVELGAQVHYSAVVVGGGVNLEWRWQEKLAGSVAWVDIQGVTVDSYSFTPVASDNGKQYRVIVSNQYGSAMSNVATLTVNYAPVIGSIPSAALASVASGYEVTAVVSGNPTPELSWLRTPNGGTIESQVSTGAKLELAGDALIAGNYRARAENSRGVVFSGYLKLGVLKYLAGQSVADGAVARFTAELDGVTNPVFTWEVKQVGAAIWKGVAGGSNSQLSIAAKMADNGSRYRVRVTSGSLSVLSNEALLSVSSSGVGTISGRVTMSGVGVAGVSVQLANVRSVQTNSLGEFLFEGLELNRSYTLIPSQSPLTFVPSRISFSLTGNRTVTFQAESGVRLSGIVTRGTDAVGGALVKLIENGSVVMVTDTDNSGYYNFPAVSRSSFVVRVEKQGVDIAEGAIDTGVGAPGDKNLDLEVREQMFLGDEILSLWNSYLGMVNVLEVNNRSDSKLRIRVTVYSAKNQTTAGNSPIAVLPWMSLGAGTQRDIIVNDIPGVNPNEYGIVRIEHDRADLDGRVSFYKPSVGEVEVGDYEFAFNLPFANAQRARSFVPFNTIQPSSHKDEVGRAVFNWLTVANGEPSLQKFDCIYYDASGHQLRKTSISVPAYGRLDVDGGHQTVGFGKVGLIEIIPRDSGAKYLAALTRYGSLRSASDGGSVFNFAFPVRASGGSGGRQVLPLTAVSGMESYVELVNLSSGSEVVEIRVYDTAGKVIIPTSRMSIAGRGQTHIKTSDLLGKKGSGTLEVVPFNDAKVYSALTTYFKDSEGHLLSADRTVGGDALTAVVKGSYNLYLDMYNWLRVYNLGTSSTTVTLELGGNGTAVRKFTRKIAAHGRYDFGLHEYQTFGTVPNSYGVISLRAQSTGSLLGEVVRLRSTGKEPVDFVFTVPLR